MVFVLVLACILFTVGYTCFRLLLICLLVFVSLAGLTTDTSMAQDLRETDGGDPCPGSFHQAHTPPKSQNIKPSRQMRGNNTKVEVHSDSVEQFSSIIDVRPCDNVGVAVVRCEQESVMNCMAAVDVTCFFTRSCLACTGSLPPPAGA